VCLAGCGNKLKSDLTFETLSVTFYDGKTVSTDMDQEAVRKNMERAPSDTLELTNSTMDEWVLNYGLSVAYDLSENVSSIMAIKTDDTSFKTSLGVSLGDSIASVKENLGEPILKDEDSCNYLFYRTEGRYVIVRGDPDYFLSSLKEEERKNAYMVIFYFENDKVESFSVRNFT
jgi:hypothetical protein